MPARHIAETHTISACTFPEVALSLANKQSQGFQVLPIFVLISASIEQRSGLRPECAALRYPILTATCLCTLMAKVKESSSTEGKIASAEATRDALMDAESKDSPVISLINKRLRAARKKVKKVEEIEAIKAGGREINADQARQPQV